MPEVTCSKTDCLNNSKSRCTAVRVEWLKGKCNDYLGSRSGMCSPVSPMERRHGALTNMKTLAR